MGSTINSGVNYIISGWNSDKLLTNSDKFSDN